MYPRHFFDAFWRTDLRDEVFVAMPFHEEFTPVWEQAIRPGIQDAGLSPRRVDASSLSGSIIIDILDGIANSRLVFADISVCRTGKWCGQRNGNVMYEVGLAHAIRQPEEVILVRNDSEPINFDVASIRVNSYDHNDLENARALFTELVEDSLRAVDRSKSLLVQRAIDMLDREMLNYLYHFGREPGFVGPAPETMGGVLSAIPNLLALSRLQSMGIIRCDPQTPEAAFYWTEFGIAVLKRLGIRGRE
ncbi:MAG: hypothetical protein NZ520_07095 [bacterium]|nr:hypothetical protein [bacterium]